MVTLASSVEGDGFIPVEVGQMVEVLDDSEKAAWLVLTLPRFEGEEQVEGFIPPQCLQHARKGVCVCLCVYKCVPITYL